MKELRFAFFVNVLALLTNCVISPTTVPCFACFLRLPFYVGYSREGLFFNHTDMGTTGFPQITENTGLNRHTLYYHIAVQLHTPRNGRRSGDLTGFSYFSVIVVVVMREDRATCHQLFKFIMHSCNGSAKT